MAAVDDDRVIAWMEGREGMTIDVGMFKPIAAALILPPVPLLLLILWGAWRMPARRVQGGLAVCMGALGIWLTACQGVATWLQDALLQPGPPMTGERMARLIDHQRALTLGAAVELPSAGASAGRRAAAIIVLGGGRDEMSSEYGTAELSTASAERLRYGIWLSRRTGVPLGFSGGVGWGQKRLTAGPEELGASEAEVGARVAREQYGWSLQWVESTSADTRQNAQHTVEMLAKQGIQEVVVVTHAFHMRRARRAFEQAAREFAPPGAQPMAVSSAPMGYWGSAERPLLEWLPSSEGMYNVRMALRECVGLLAGA